MSVTLEEFEARKSSYTGRPRKENPADYVDLREKFSTYDALEYEQKNSPYNQDWKALTAFKNGLQSVGEGISGFGVMIQDMVIDSAKEHNPDNSQLDLWKQSIHEHHEADREGIYKQTPVASSSDIGQLGLDVVQGAAQMVPAAVASLLPGGQAVGALVMGASIAGNEYDELRDQGVDERTAASAATINALIQTPFEYIGLSKVFKGLPVTSSLRGYAREFAERVATEGITEFIQEYPEQVSRLWALNSDKPIEDVAEVVRNELGNITSDAAYSGLIGGILGGGLGGAHMGLSSSFQHAMTKEIHNTKMDIVEKQIENITATETNPAVAATVINSTTNNEMVYVDGSTVREYAQTSGNMRELAIVLGVQEEDIKRAAADGDYLDVRLGNFEAAAAKYNGFFQAVKDDTSFEDGGYTVNGEKLYKQEIEQVKRKTAELEVEQDNVLNSMLTAGVERKQANALLTILTNYAMMMHPENPAQWMRENGLKFQKDIAPGNAFSQQNQNFKEWFGKSKVVDSNGKPLVVYHGTDVYDLKKFKKGKHGYLGGAIYLTSDKSVASRYTNYGDVHELYARIENPLEIEGGDNAPLKLLKAIYGEEKGQKLYDKRKAKQESETHIITNADIKKLTEMGHDGVAWKVGNTVEYAVYDPNQIKSVKNNGSYSTTDNNIYKQGRKYEPEGVFEVLSKEKQEEVRNEGKKLADKLDELREQEQNKIFKPEELCSVCKTPDIFLELGFKSEDIVIRAQELLGISKNKKNNWHTDHSMFKGILREIPKAMQDPLCIIDSINRPGRVVAILDIDMLDEHNNSSKVFIPIELDGSTGTYRKGNELVRSHIVTTMYPRAITKISTDLQNIIKKNPSNNGRPQIYYLTGNKNKAALISPTRVQFPIGLISNSLKLRQSIAQKYNSVNSRYHQKARQTVDDTAYMEAVEKYEAETDETKKAELLNQINGMVKEAADRSGYGRNEEYREGHEAPRASVAKEDFKNLEKLAEVNEEGEPTNLYAVANDIHALPEDWRTHPDWYFYEEGWQEAFKAINKAINAIKKGKDAEVKVYRAVPTNIKGKNLESEGQWVSPSKEYAKLHGENVLDGDYTIVEQKVKATDLWWDCNSICEWGYDDGNKYMYNTDVKNNIKSIDPITYDDNGNVIPLSQRFNAKKADIHYQDNSVIKGAFNPEMQDGQYVISLFNGADASTVIHETGHYFIETMWKAIESGQATKQVEKDFDTLLEYAGMTREAWAAADVQGRSAAHERLAEAFESYIMEGKAPSEQLREAFRKFAEWLKAVYQTIRRSENAIPLTDDVRQVFDRMLAAQDDIAEAERVNKYFAELPKAITENMSEATKARVEKFIDNAREKALDVLTRKAMENFSSERQEEISNYRAEILPEVTEEIKERRTYKNGYTREDVKKYQALQDIVTGENEVGKELTPEDEVYMMQFDLTAESFGYSSTNEMVQDIMNSPTEKQAITQAVNELVNAKFPDYMTEKKAREEAIQEAIYNDENGLLIGVEQQLIEEYATKAMNRQMEAEAKKEASKVEGGEKKQGPAAKTKEEMRIRAAAYRQQAKTMAKEAIGRMIISDATRTQKYVTLERRAAMKSAECMAKKDYREALTQKNLQAYYHAMVQESIKAKRMVDKNRRYLKRQVKAKKEAWVSEAHFAEVSALFMRMGIAHKKHDDTGRIGVTLREYADAMNEKYDCAEFADWLLNMPDYEPLSDTRMYTLEQFNDMVDAVRNIRAIAKAEKGVGMFEKAKSFEELKKDILENLDKLKTVFTPDPNKPTQATLTERFWAALENSDTFFERMDNWSQGFFTNTFFAKIKHSNDMEYDCREKYDKAVIEANNEWLPDKAAMAAAEEKIYYEELGTSVSKHILVKMLMNMGNKENARRLAETCPIGFEKGTIWNPMSEDSMLLPEEALELTQHNILEFLQKNLTAEDVRYAQKMVNAAGSFWTEKNEMEKRVKGFGLKKVEATPQVLTIGGKEVVFQGGYFPLIRNGELGSHPVTQEVGADDPLQGRNIRTLHTNSGSTKHRTLGVKYPVNLFPGAETQVMYDSIHDLCWRECVNDFRRVLNDGDIYTALKTKLGPARMSVFREMLEKAAQPNSTQSADFAERTVGAAASWLRNKSANAIIMMNLKINLQNFGNVFLFGQSVEGFGHADTLHALGNFKMNFADAKGYSDLTEFIFSKSAFMRERMTIPDISVRDIMEDPTNKQSEFEKSVLRLGTKLMVYTDGVTAKPVWLEAYRKSLANGKTEQEAVDFADTVIRRTLGSTRMTDVSSLQRGGAIYKLMTMFQSFFNTQYNQWVREKNLVQKMYTEGQKREAFENAFAFVTSKFVFTCMASLALSLENPFGIDDDDGWPELLKEMKNYSFSMFGPVGQVGSNLVGNMLGMKEFGYRMSVVQSTLEKMTRTGKTVNKVVTGESKTPVADMAETTTDVAGFVLGVPQQVNKVLWNTYDILVNDMDPRLEDLTRRRPKKERKPDK